jgi:hypothetical protein
MKMMCRLFLGEKTTQVAHRLALGMFFGKRFLSGGEQMYRDEKGIECWAFIDTVGLDNRSWRVLTERMSFSSLGRIDALERRRRPDIKLHLVDFGAILQH